MANSTSTPLQRTLKQEVRFSGVGLHTGAMGRLLIQPAAAGEGLYFSCRGHRIPALAHHVDFSIRCTRLRADNVELLTPEHVLAALFGLRVDNACLSLEGPEVPILDGSAAPFVEAILGAGIISQNAPARVLKLRGPIWAADGERHILALPSDSLSLTMATDFRRPCAGPTVMSLLFSSDVALAADCFATQLAAARTFCFRDEVEAILASGLAVGGSLENVLVLSDEGPSTSLRYADEPIRHKALDLLGDLALVGGRLNAHVIAVKAGHALHTAAAEQIRRTTDDVY